MGHLEKVIIKTSASEVQGVSYYFRIHVLSQVFVKVSLEKEGWLI
jgi:hypothetical protein